MTKSLIKNTFREIRNTKARFFSIMLIIALGVGFFAGIKSTAPSMYRLAEDYYRDNNLMDYRIVSTVGFDKKDVEAISETDGVTDVMPSYCCEVLETAENGGEIIHLMALPKEDGKNKELNKVVLKKGRLPKKTGEIAIENGVFSDVKYTLGDTVELSPTAGDTDVREELTTLKYKIVGIVESPLYISYQRGTTTVGDGKIDQYMYIPRENFSLQRYTELYVKTKASDNYSAFSDTYEKEIDKFTSVLKDKGNVQCDDFSINVIGKAEKDLQDAKNKYRTEHSNAYGKLAEGKKKLQTAQSEFNRKIKNGENKLKTTLEKIEKGEQDLAFAKDKYYSEIAQAEIKINDSQEKIDKANIEYKEAKKKFDKEIKKAQSKIDKGWDSYNSAYDEFKNNQEPQLVERIQLLERTIELFETDYNDLPDTITKKDIKNIKKILENMDEQDLSNLTELLNSEIDIESDFGDTGESLSQIVSEMSTQDMEESWSNLATKYLPQAKKSLKELKSQYSKALSKFKQSESKIEKAQSVLDEKKNSGEEKLNKAKNEIDSGKEKVAAAKKELETQKNNGYNKIVKAEEKLSNAKSQYNSGTKELKKQKTAGEKRLKTALANYKKQKTNADKKFAQARQKIKEAQRELDSINQPQWYIFNRDDNPGYSTFSQNADRLDAVASVFPVFFLLVAVLVCVTTMTRLIEEKRTEIGTFKALGYSNFSIIMKFVIYSLFAGLIGSGIGIAAGIFTMPYIIYNAYKIMFYIGDITLVPHIPSIIIGVCAAVVCTTMVSVIVCVGSLKQKPAATMRPKAPKAGKRIFLEHIKPLWGHMNFTAKLTSRNLLRYKSRLSMTVIGVAGCCALIVAAFGLLNSFEPLTHDQFEKIYKYNTIVVAKDKGTKRDLKGITDIVSQDSNVKAYSLAVQEEAQVNFKGEKKDDGVYLEVIEDSENIESIVSLHRRKDKKKLNLTDTGVLINEKLSEEMGIAVGDYIKISSDSGKSEVKVQGIYEQYINNFIYMTPALYKNLYGNEAKYNMVDVVLGDTSEKAENSFSQRCLDDSRIVAVSYTNSMLNDFRNMLNSLNMVVLVMIVCAAALAFVVLYNLTNINIAERVREIATFKVLGFYNKETAAFIYIENIVLTLLGIGIGLVMGNFLTGFIVQTVEVDNIMFGRDIFVSSYLYAMGLTMLFSLLVLFVMKFKIKAVDMVESLKSVE